MAKQTKIRYKLAGGLSGAQVEKIHATALRVLAEVGIKIEHAALLKKLSGADGIRVDGGRVRFEPETVETAVAEYRAAQAAEARTARGRRKAEPPFTLAILNGYAFNLLDPRTNELRPMNTGECIETAKLVDALHPAGVRGGTPGLPQDVPPRLRDILAYKIGCEHTRSPGWVGTTAMESGEYIRRMAEAMGLEFGTGIYVLDPLCLGGSTLDMALEFLERRIPVKLFLFGMPMRGATTPFHLPAALAESLATILGAHTALKLAGAQVYFSINIFPFDMKFGGIAMGTPDHLACHLACSQVNAFYNGPEAGAAAVFQTNSLFPDAGAVMRRAALGAAAAFAGARTFCYGGLLGIDKIFSPEMLLLDLEIVDYIRHMVEPFAFSEETLGLDMIREVGAGGEYITHPSTLENCRSLWASDLFPNLSPERWAAELRTAAQGKILKKLDGLAGAEGFRLAPDLKNKLDKIYEEACGKLA